ncbi:MAG: hypothetical protein ACI92B_001868 [Marinobacter maritimus]|jgi:hypothetical protein|uniref:DUF4845 domain-containing protein n=1 Tax=Marinobacter maritimus TaxID=277961 RepID=UPI000BCDE937|nr:DUF4845 domain-containing protein [Marinobacter maritimus]MBL1272644.1 DUF4845 domain-containing protein [Oceanospirillales bacterium]|tara:strand:- start:2243 stop:2632 length:390 start_codon:yes stop_codon:yes gene_type:complete
MKKNNLSAMGRQSGASALVILIMVLFFGSLLSLVIKIGPVYMDDHTIQQALEGLDGTEGLSRMGPAQLRTLINKRLSVNNIRGFDAKDITVEKDGELVIINVDYEVRNNIFRNVDTVVHFQHKYELKGK